MGYKINWNKIKGGYRGFEKLAVSYVQKEIENNFKPTVSTRDGNKDAIYKKDKCTIILGYQAMPSSDIEWWMEAKYSESKADISRYKIDATLVSAILKRNVERIIIVTNMNVSSQVANDIRQAIIGTTVCNQVNFCTRNTLEFWLYQNIDILADFFLDYNGDKVELESLMIVENIKYFTCQDICYSYKEDLQTLELTKSYSANFTLYSNTEQSVSIKASSSLKGIKILNNRKLNLHIGINDVKFFFSLESEYGYRSTKRQEEHFQLPEPSFRINNLQITSEKNITIIKNNSNYVIPCQKKAEEEIFSYFSPKNKKGTYVFYIYGQSGVGKQRVIDNYLDSMKHMTVPFYIAKMTGDYHKDIRNIIDCINYIYFPYLLSDDVSLDYINAIEGNYYPSLFKEIITCNKNEKQISNLLFEYISEDKKLFPLKVSINPRHIIFTNLEKANTLLINALYKIIIELSDLEEPFQFILSGEWIQHTSLYNVLTKKVNLRDLELQITSDDCIEVLSDKLLNNQIVEYIKDEHMFSSMIEMLMFAEYLNDNNYVTSNFENFQIFYHLFCKEEIMDLYIKKIFEKVLSKDEKVSKLCNKVYWNANGIPRTNSEEERKLLSYHIVKMDSTGCNIVPYHDSYTRCYRKNYEYSELSDIPFLQLLQYESLSKIRQIVDELHTEYINKNYIVVYYTLEPLFRKPNSTYKNLMDDVTYYRLYMDFAHSCAFCSLDYSGGMIFNIIYNETKNLLYMQNSDIRIIHNTALWELTNSTFESLNYNCAIQRCNELVSNINKLLLCENAKSKSDAIIQYHNANVIKCLIMSELEAPDWEKNYEKSLQEMERDNAFERLWSFKVRYSLTLMQRNFEETISLLSNCLEYYKSLNNNSEKYYLWTKFYLAYMRMITSSDEFDKYQSEKIVFDTLEKMRDLFFNDYRKMRYGLIYYLYYCDKTSEADKLLLQEQRILRGKRPRLQGFEHIILALKYIKEKNNKKALDRLKFAYEIFKHIPSYEKLIHHNITMLEKFAASNITKIEYYFESEMQEDTYYLDIRACW